MLGMDVVPPDLRLSMDRASNRAAVEQMAPSVTAIAAVHIDAASYGRRAARIALGLDAGDAPPDLSWLCCVPHAQAE
jgi:hypothetical protein